MAGPDSSLASSAAQDISDLMVYSWENTTIFLISAGNHSLTTERRIGRSPPYPLGRDVSEEKFLSSQSWADLSPACQKVGGKERTRVS